VQWVRRPMARDKWSGNSRRLASPAEKQDAERPTSGEPGQWLSRSLRRIYDETLQEPIPDSLRGLLEELERRDKAKP
jgi:hypothetical protein